MACPNCGHALLVGTLYCGYCGTKLTDATSGTKQITPADTIPLPLVSWGVANFALSAQLMLRIADKSLTTVLLDAATVGRINNETGVKPDIDLAAFDAEACGVSRLHAKLTRKEGAVVIEDLGSRNWTFVAGRRVEANNPVALRDGDEIRLGRLVVHVYFK